MTSSEIIDAIVKVIVALIGAAGFWQIIQGSRERKSAKEAAAKQQSAADQSIPEALMLLSRQELREDYAECRTSLTSLRTASERMLQLLDVWRSRLIVAAAGTMTLTLAESEVEDMRERANDVRGQLN